MSHSGHFAPVASGHKHEATGWEHGMTVTITGGTATEPWGVHIEKLVCVPG
jgi:hypothetical protein